MAYREDVSTLKLNDTKNTFIFPMTSIGKLTEVQQKSMRKKVWNLLLLDEGQCKH